jgi:predicted amidohydrolase
MPEFDIGGSSMSDRVKIAAVQMEPKLMKSGENLGSILGWVSKAAASQANLVVFPECCLTGYIFHSREEALPFAETIPGPSTEAVISLCQELGVYVIFGLIEKEGDKLFNAAALVGPQGLIAGYRKNHLPFLGVDRFCNVGDRPFEVHQTPIGNIGIYICYDIVFPESSRVMTLMGADILALPTNFPEVRRETLATYVVNARAIENRVHVVAADRVGRERGYAFAGLSKIVSASGNTLSLASPDKEEIIYGEVSLASARKKRLVVVPGEYELDYIKDRRPELYGLITGPGLGGA